MAGMSYVVSVWRPVNNVGCIGGNSHRSIQTVFARRNWTCSRSTGSLVVGGHGSRGDHSFWIGAGNRWSEPLVPFDDIWLPPNLDKTQTHNPTKRPAPNVGRTSASDVNHTGLNMLNTWMTPYNTVMELIDLIFTAVPSCMKRAHACIKHCHEGSTIRNFNISKTSSDRQQTRAISAKFHLVDAVLGQLSGSNAKTGHSSQHKHIQHQVKQ